MICINLKYENCVRRKLVKCQNFVLVFLTKHEQNADIRVSDIEVGHIFIYLIFKN